MKNNSMKVMVFNEDGKYFGTYASITESSRRMNKILKVNYFTASKIYNSIVCDIMCHNWKFIKVDNKTDSYIETLKDDGIIINKHRRDGKSFHINDYVYKDDRYYPFRTFHFDSLFQGSKELKISIKKIKKHCCIEEPVFINEIQDDKKIVIKRFFSFDNSENKNSKRGIWLAPRYYKSVNVVRIKKPIVPVSLMEIKTGSITNYASINACARALHLNVRTVRSLLLGNQKTIKKHKYILYKK